MSNLWSETDVHKGIIKTKRSDFNSFCDWWRHQNCSIIKIIMMFDCNDIFIVAKLAMYCDRRHHNFNIQQEESNLTNNFFGESWQRAFYTKQSSKHGRPALSRNLMITKQIKGHSHAYCNLSLLPFRWTQQAVIIPGRN